MPRIPPRIPATECGVFVYNMCMTSPVIRLQVSVEKARAKKRERLEKIIVLARKRYAITNNDVQILLGVSDATATRYLSELVRAGRLQRVGAQKRPRYQLV